MRILLIILTVTGILLLVLLVLAAVCLFYPVSYRIKGEAEEEMSLYGRFRWLLGLLWFEFEVRDFKPKMRFGIFGFKMSFGGEEAKEEPRAEQAQAGQGADVPAQKEHTAAREKIPGTQTGGKGAGPSAAAEMPGKEAGGAVPPVRHSPGKDGAEKRGRGRKKPGQRRFRKKRRKAFQGKGGRQRSPFRAELSDKKNHMAVKHLWQEATYIFLHLKPKYAKGAVYFAAGDPALTGQITGALSLLPAMYQYDACVCPDFVSDGPYIRGTITFGGRISLYCAVLCLIRIIRDENAMRLIQKFR